MSTARTTPVDRDGVAARELVTSDNVQDESQHQINSTGKLLQLAQAASGSIMQIPADILTSLLHTLNSLQNSVLELKQENRGLQQALSSVEKNVLTLQIYSGMEFGMEFTLFPKLPLEIQRMIWRHSANIPQVIGIKGIVLNGDPYIAPTMSHCQQLRVCKEARNEVSKMKFPLEFTPDFLPRDESDVPKIFVNPSTDTLWLTTPVIDLDYGSFKINLPYIFSRWFCFGNCPDQRKVQFKKLALPYKYWWEMLGLGRLEIMDALYSLGVEEVILVVGDDSTSEDPNIVFIKPRGEPKPAIANEFFTVMGWRERITWEDMADASVQYLKNFQAQDAADRKKYLLGKFKMRLFCRAKNDLVQKPDTRTREMLVMTISCHTTAQSGSYPGFDTWRQRQ
jgi:hypothetical protein